MRYVSWKYFGAVVLVGLAACNQTYTAANGTTKTTSVPRILVDVDETREVLEAKSQKWQDAKPGSKYYKSINSVVATGFKTGILAMVDIPVDNSGAQAAVTDSLNEANFVSSNGRYVLHMALDEARLGSRDNPGTVLLINYTVRDKSGKEVASFKEESAFHVPFKAAPMGAVRSRLQFIGSLNNNLAQLTKRLQ